MTSLTLDFWAFFCVVSMLQPRPVAGFEPAYSILWLSNAPAFHQGWRHHCQNFRFRSDCAPLGYIIWVCTFCHYGLPPGPCHDSNPLPISWKLWVTSNADLNAHGARVDPPGLHVVFGRLPIRVWIRLGGGLLTSPRPGLLQRQQQLKCLGYRT